MNLDGEQARKVLEAAGWIPSEVRPGVWLHDYETEEGHANFALAHPITTVALIESWESVAIECCGKDWLVAPEHNEQIASCCETLNEAVIAAWLKVGDDDD